MNPLETICPYCAKNYTEDEIEELLYRSLLDEHYLSKIIQCVKCGQSIMLRKVITYYVSKG